jgi:FMN-dependent NADH-azoreductase
VLDLANKMDAEMTMILHIDASARDDQDEIPRHRSLSRQLSRRFVNTWTTRRPTDQIIRRDLASNPPPFINQTWISAVFTPSETRTVEQREAVAISDVLISELRSADVIVIGTPMYNYGMPAVLKAWIDQVVRIGKTFTFDLARGDYPLEPILTNKTLVLLTSTGEFDFQPGGARENMNHLDTHVRSVAPYLGANEFRHISVTHQEFGDERHEASKVAAFAAAADSANAMVDEIVELTTTPAKRRNKIAKR